MLLLMLPPCRAGEELDVAQMPTSVSEWSAVLGGAARQMLSVVAARGDSLLAVVLKKRRRLY